MEDQPYDVELVADFLMSLRLRELRALAHGLPDKERAKKVPLVDWIVLNNLGEALPLWEADKLRRREEPVSVPKVPFTVVHEDRPDPGVPWFATEAGARKYLEEVVVIRDEVGVKEGKYSVQPVTPPASVIVSLTVENAYELHESVTFTVTDVILPAPPSAPTAAALELAQHWLDTMTASGTAEDLAMDEALGEWAQEHIMETPLTGVGHEDGDSYYDVTITASTMPSLVGRKFTWGY